MKNIKIDYEKAQEDILSYLKLLLEKKGMGNLPSEILANMLVDLHIRFNNYLFVSVLQGLNGEGYKKIDEFLESDPTPEESTKFLQENVSGIDQLIEKAREEFERIYLEE